MWMSVYVKNAWDQNVRWCFWASAVHKCWWNDWLSISFRGRDSTLWCLHRPLLLSLPPRPLTPHFSRAAFTVPPFLFSDDALFSLNDAFAVTSIFYSMVMRSRASCVVCGWWILSPHTHTHTDYIWQAAAGENSWIFNSPLSHCQTWGSSWQPPGFPGWSESPVTSSSVL